MTARHIAAYLFLAIAWGLSFLVLLKVVQAFGWGAAVTLRALVAAGTLYLLARAMGFSFRWQSSWKHLGIIGLSTVAVQLVGLSYGTPLIGTAMAAILVATIPLFSMLIGQAWGTETLGRTSILGLLLGFMGLVLLVGFPAEPITSSFVIGCAALLVSAFAAAFGSNYASRFLADAPSLEVTIAAFFIGGVLTLPLLAIAPLPKAPDMMDVFYLLLAGAGMSGLTYAVYFWLVGEIGPTRSVSVEFAVTLVAVLTGAIFLGESITPIQIVGGCVIIMGCALVLGLLPFRPKPQVPG
jgi:drug/metabolite transporter (DMT)-like permease